jgi:hypothetical protein
VDGLPCISKRAFPNGVFPNGLASEFAIFATGSCAGRAGRSRRDVSEEPAQAAPILQEVRRAPLDQSSASVSSMCLRLDATASSHAFAPAEAYFN